MKEFSFKIQNLTFSIPDCGFWSQSGSGRGAFCGPVKVSREASWRGQKRLCRHK
jgi:hypothetical protein